MSIHGQTDVHIRYVQRTSTKNVIEQSSRSLLISLASPPDGCLSLLVGTACLFAFDYILVSRKQKRSFNFKKQYVSVPSTCPGGSFPFCRQGCSHHTANVSSNLPIARHVDAQWRKCTNRNGQRKSIQGCCTIRTQESKMEPTTC